MRSVFVWACAFGLFAWAATPAFAEEEAPVSEAAVAEEALAPNLSTAPPSSGQLPLSVRDAVARALENNLDVELFRYDPAIAAYEARAAWGLHEPVFGGDATYQSANVPTANSVASSSDRRVFGGTGIQGILPLLGWQYSFGYSGQKVSANSVFTSLRPEYRAGLSGSLTMPLLRGFLYGSPWIQVRLAREGSGIAEEEFRRRLMDVVRGTEDAYWGLAAAARTLEVAKKSLETSTALLNQVQARFRVGVVSRVEVTEAEAGVADRRFQLIGAENAYRAAQDRLIDTVFGPALTPTSSLEIVASDSPDEYQKLEVDPEIATEKALANRPELLAAVRQADAQRIRRQFARNSRLPQLDMVAAYTTHGLSGVESPTRICFDPANPGAGCQPLPSEITGPYGDTHNQFFDGDDNRTWYAGARFSVPIGNSTARSNLRISDIEVHRAETAVDRQRQAIIAEVRNAVRNLQSAIEGIEAADEGLRSASEQLRAETIRLEHGESTPFEVLQREEARVRAESRRIGALTFYHISAVALDRAQGTLLEDRGIAVDGVKRSRIE
jgi:outer membrane protein